MRTCTTCWRTCRRFAEGGLRRGATACASARSLVAVVLCRAAAQGVDPAALLKPPADSWPTYHGDYSGQRHSRLTQITPANVAPARRWRGRSRPDQTQQIKATPILVNGVIYVTTPDNLWAIDARSGRQIWRYTYPANDGFHIGHRGAPSTAISVYLTTPDAHLRRARRAQRHGEVERRDRRREDAATGRRTRRSSSATT